MCHFQFPCLSVAATKLQSLPCTIPQSVPCPLPEQTLHCVCLCLIFGPFLCLFLSSRENQKGLRFSRRSLSWVLHWDIPTCLWVKWRDIQQWMLSSNGRNMVHWKCVIHRFWNILVWESKKVSELTLRPHVHPPLQSHKHMRANVQVTMIFFWQRTSLLCNLCKLNLADSV